VAADHPARGITASNGDPLIMGNRHQYLGRVLRVITSEEFDGVMGTTDILEDLFLVNYLLKGGGKKPFLDLGR
ncbi:aldolase, partial [Dehalococcoidia bacterium]|nr:aldolase [Dehalococcoidia bacterium]